MTKQATDNQPTKFVTTPEAKIKFLERLRLARRNLHPDAGKADQKT